jgi:hypothetical protein
MTILRDKSQHSTESAEILRTWASLYEPASVSWSPVTEMIRVAEADVCIRLRRILPALSTRISLVKTAMFVAFISAVETNLLNLVAPQQTEAVERLFYAKTIEHLKRCLEGGTV